MSEFNPTLPTKSYGDLTPGCHIIWKENEYVLRFGWHINHSNQNIYSWYLEPVEKNARFVTTTGYDSFSAGYESYIRTLYKEMIDEISSVRYLAE